MAALFRNRDLSFTALRDGLGLTDGNLGSHAQRLADAGYVEARRALAGLHFEVRYRITPRGSEAYRAYAAALLAILGAAPPTEAPDEDAVGSRPHGAEHPHGSPSASVKPRRQ